MPKLSIIIPTIGRDHLWYTIASIREQLGTHEDEIIVVGDGQQLIARGIMSIPDWRFHYFEHGPTNHSGNEQRDFGMDRATGDFLWFVDDDDTIAPDALKVIHTAIAQDPNLPHMFCMQIGNDIFSSAGAAQGGPQLIVPNIKEKLGRWSGETYAMDQHFKKVVESNYAGWIDHPEIIYQGAKYGRGIK